MRVKIHGGCESAKVLRAYLRKDGTIAVTNEFGDYNIYLEQNDDLSTVLVDGIDCDLERKIIANIEDLGVEEFILARKGGIRSDRAVRIVFPSKYKKQVEKGAFRGLHQELLNSKNKIEPPQLTPTTKKQKLATAARSLAFPVVVVTLLLIMIAAHGHSAELLPRGFTRTHPILFQPTNFPIIRFWDGSTVKNASFTGTSINVNCTGGCGGASSFLDNSAFTAGTTSINISGGVFNDGLAAVTSGNAAAPRITADRGLHVNLRSNAGAEVGIAAAPIRIDPTGTTTQPVSGTVTANAGTGTFATDPTDEDARVLGRAKIHDGVDTALVSGTGALNVTCDNCGAPPTFQDEDLFTVSTTAISNIGFLVDETLPDSAPEDTAAAPRMSLNRNIYTQIRDLSAERSAAVTAANALKVDNSAVTQPVSGTVTVTATDLDIRNLTSVDTVTVTDGAGALNVIVDTFPDNEPINVAQVGGTAITAPTTIPTSALAGMAVRQPISCTSKIAISQTADTQVVTGVASQFIYICSIALIAGAAETVNIIEGTGSVCATTPTAVYGSTTEANGMPFGANGGFSQASGQPFMRTTTLANNLCITQVGTARVSGSISYIVAP